MRIEEINIYGFGKLENLKITDLKNLNVFYGENEAGKTTIMEFIHAILFGFPTRQQRELRYEPKLHSKYGGMLVVRTPKYGRLTIERVKGKAIGDVTVTLPSGEIGDEDLLNELLEGLDKTTFRSIYSFNLHDLQKLDELNNEDLNKILFSSGALGTDKLNYVERELEKKLDRLYKQRGQVPLINKQMKELNKDYEQLMVAKQSNDTYFKKLQMRDQLETKSASLLEEVALLNDSIMLLKDWQEQRPLLNELEEIDGELEQIGEMTFPAEGKKRYEQLKQSLGPLEENHKKETGKINHLKIKKLENHYNEAMLENEHQLAYLIESVAHYDSNLQKYNDLRSAMKDKTTMIANERAEFNLIIDENKLAQLDTSSTVKTKLAKVLEDLNRVNVLKSQLQADLEQKQQALAAMKRQIAELEEDILREDERNLLERQLEQAKSIKAKQEEYNQLKASVSSLSRSEKDPAKAAQNNNLKMIILFSIILAIMGGLSYFTGQFLVAIISAASILGLLAIMIFSKISKGGQGDYPAEQNYYKDRLAELGKVLDQAKNYNLAEIKERLAFDDNLKADKRSFKLSFERAEAELANDKKTLKEQVKQVESLRSACNFYAEEWEVPLENIELNGLETLAALGKIKNLLLQKEQLKASLKTAKKNLSKFEEEVNSVVRSYDLPEYGTIHEQIFNLKDKLFSERQKRLSYEEAVTLLDSALREERDLFAKKLDEKQAMANLFNSCGARSEEEYYLLSEKSKRRNSLLESRSSLKRFIKDGLKEEISKQKEKLPTIAFTLEACNNKLDEISRERNELDKQLAELNHQIAVLEEGGSYAELLHKFKMKEGNFNDLAREWAVYQYAHSLLKKTTNKYKEEQLPAILEACSSYFEVLTDSRYKKVILDEGSGFKVRRSDHIYFEPKELSQATMEQLYISLRLALVSNFSEQNNSFPIIIDDSFVNFDQERVKLMLGLLAEFSDKTQVLYFTCHEHLLTYFADENLIRLAELS